MKILHDSRNINYRNPFGAVEAGTEVTLSVSVAGADVVEAVLQYRRDEEEAYTSVQMSEVPCGPKGVISDQSQDVRKAADASDKNPDGHMLTAVIKAPEESCLLWYRFKLTLSDDCGTHSIYYCNNKEGYGGRGRTKGNRCVQISCL